MKYKKLLICADNHGWYENTKTTATLLDFKRDFKPDTTIHLGDNWDFSCLRKKATSAERKEELLEDYDEGADFLRRLQPNVFIWGNHDNRINDFLHRNQYSPKRLASIARDAANRSVSSLEEFGAINIYGRIVVLFAELGIDEVVPYSVKNYYKLGKWKFIHGFAYGNNPSEKMSYMYGNCISGDVHRFSSFTTASDPLYTGYTIGSLCLDEQMGYQKNMPSALRHENGFAYGYMNNSGDLKLEFARKTGDEWILPTLK